MSLRKPPMIITVKWAPGQKATHLACVAVATVAGSSRAMGRRTGCSCGSIENNPRRSDCARCQFDA